MKIRCKVIAGARQAKVVGLRRDEAGIRAEEEVKIYVTAPPVDGKANRAVIKLLAEALGLPVRALVIVQGVKSNHKVIEIDE